MGIILMCYFLEYICSHLIQIIMSLCGIYESQISTAYCKGGGRGMHFGIELKTEF